MEFSAPSDAKKPPRRKDDRVILHFDYDCFYAQVVENQQPALKAVPLGIKQKGILATCNYKARERGVKKLMLIFEAKKICPDLVLADGEDLSSFRDVSKKLYSLVRGYSWNDKVERLGLDEVFLDVTDLVAYNMELLNPHALEQSFLYLSREDPECGFPYDATLFAGCVHEPGISSQARQSNRDVQSMRLLIASHLARHIRLKIEEEGYTSACGISTNKVLAKLAGTENKPRNQTTLLALQESDVLSYMDKHGLRKVPGIGAKTTRILESHVTGKELDSNVHTMNCSVTVGQVRSHPGMSPQLLERLFSGPGSERGLGAKIWALLHGVDDAEVKTGADVPTQISIEDTYKGLNEMTQINAELRKLSASLLRRMHVDLVEKLLPALDGQEASRRWMAHPKTIRLSTAPKWSASDGKPYMFGRSSRSQALPSFVLNLSVPSAEIVERLVVEILLGMFGKLNPAPHGWNIGMLNICVANMVPTGTETGVGSGRDIASMFKQQKDVLREFTVYETSEEPEGRGKEAPQQETPGLNLSPDESWDSPMDGAVFGPAVIDVSDGVDDDIWEEDSNASADAKERCPLCDHLIPIFALAAHDRFHQQTS